MAAGTCELRQELYASRKIDIAARLWAHVDSSAGTDACWPWTGAVSDDGYGYIVLANPRNGTRVRDGAHRAAWALTHSDAGELHVLGFALCHSRCNGLGGRPLSLF